MSLLKRITDLFTEGTEVYLGDDGGKPIVIWVNQLNSFEQEDARLDGQLRRSERMSQLASDDSPERLGLIAELDTLDTDDIAKRYANQQRDEVMMGVYQDLETDPDYRDLQDRCIRLPELFEQQGLAADDPRRDELADAQERWTGMIQKAAEKALAETLEDAKNIDREALIKAYLEKWREQATIEVFAVERRLTELWFAMRECEAVDVDDTEPRKHWDHSGCDHTKRLSGTDREAVRGLPEYVLAKASDAIGALRINPREAGNLGARASSSDSSERPAVQEDSMVSIPVAPPIEPPTL